LGRHRPSPSLLLLLAALAGPVGGGARAEQDPPLERQYQRIRELADAGFPTYDLHVHLKGGLTLEQALDVSRRSGMRLGIAVNCGRGFPVEDDAGAAAFLKTLEGQAVLVAMQGEGREWTTTFSKQTRARYRLPSERFLRLAKARGARFTFGTNNAGAADFGDWSYPLEMQQRLGLAASDMFVPGRQPSRARR
jgi:hypothetical protein